jgi:hypothetical protein
VKEMSLCDPYQELELYLERAKNEITQVFENGVVESSSNSVEDDDCKNEKIDYELDPFLLQFNATIKSDLSELLSRYRQRQNGNGVSYAGVNNKVNNEDCFKWTGIL